MSSTLNINIAKLTLEEVKALLTYNSPHDVLSAVARMPTSDYSSDTKRYELIPELIAKQYQLSQLCFAKGAKLREVFQTISNIPSHFIENNLSLIIASEYNPTEVLQHITETSSWFYNPLSLITQLIDNHKADVCKLSSVSSRLNSSSIEFLLNKGMSSNVLKGTNSKLLIKLAFENHNNNKEKQKNYFELAFKNGANASSFKGLDVSVKNCDEDIFKLLIEDYKVSAQDLLNLLVRPEIKQYKQMAQKFELNQALITKQTALANCLIDYGAKLKDVIRISNDFAKNNFKLIIENKVNAKVLDLHELTLEEVKALLTYNSPQEVLTLMDKVSIKKYPGNTKQFELSPEFIAEEDKLIQLCTPNSQDTFNGNNIFKQGVKTYSINLLWIHSEKNTEQQYLHPSKTLEGLETKLLMPAIKWAKSNPTADINIWYDSNLYAPQTISNTQEALTSLASKEGCTNIKLQDIRKISVVQDNADLFADGMPLYFRIDLLKMILCLYSLTKELKEAAIFSDLEVGDLRQDGQRMSKAELFDAESMRKLKKVGALVNGEDEYPWENQYLQVINGEHIISSLKFSINVCLSAATAIWNGEKNSSSSSLEISQMHLIPFEGTVKGLSKYFTGSKYGTIKVRADIVKEGQNNQWITYNPSKHSSLVLKEITNYSKVHPRKDPFDTTHIIQFRDPMGFLRNDSNTARKVDVRKGHVHSDKYNLKKIGSILCCKPIETTTEIKEENLESTVNNTKNDRPSLGSIFLDYTLTTEERVLSTGEDSDFL